MYEMQVVPMQNLSTDHTFILRLLEHGGVDVQTLASASFSTATHIQRLVDDLIEKELVMKEWNGSRYYYRKK